VGGDDGSVKPPGFGFQAGADEQHDGNRENRDRGPFHLHMLPAWKTERFHDFSLKKSPGGYFQLIPATAPALAQYQTFDVSRAIQVLILPS
jgi:hypothetical protein